MKLLNGGNSIFPISYDKVLYNCTRNKACQPAYFVPIKAMSDIVMGGNVSGTLPDTINIQVYNACNLQQTPGTAIAGKYVMGRRPEGDSYYLVLGNLTVVPPAGVTYTRFFLKITLNKNVGVDQFYYSQMFEIDPCNDLTLITGCYPDEPTGTMAYDVNGVYYGFPKPGAQLLGDPTYRYYHNYYVRNGSVTEHDIKMNTVRFKSRRAYKTTVTRSSLFEFEFIPGFYKNELLSAFARGQVTLDGNNTDKYTLAEEQSWTIVNEDSKQWKMDVVFDTEYKQSFGCDESTCLPPVKSCCDPSGVSASVELINCELPSFSGDIPQGTAGVSYFQSFDIDGALPFDFGAIDKPAWLGVSVSNTTGNVVFSGVPPEGGSYPVKFTITNCGGVVTVITVNLNVAGCTNAYFQAISECQISYADCALGTPNEITIEPGRSWSACIQLGSFLLVSGTGTFYDNGPC